MAAAVVFPIEVDLTRGTFTYNTTGQFNDEPDDDEEEEEEGGGGEEAGTNSVAVTGDLLISTDWRVIGKKVWINSADCVMIFLFFLRVLLWYCEKT